MHAISYVCMYVIFFFLILFSFPSYVEMCMQVMDSSSHQDFSLKRVNWKKTGSAGLHR